MGVQNQTVLVTGASRGLGRAVAMAFLRAGAHVIAMDNDSQALQETRAALHGYRGQFSVVQLDILDEAAVAEAITAFDRLDIVINNLNVVYRNPLLETSTRELRILLEMNVVAPFIVMREAARFMIDHGGGHIINIAGIAATRAMPNMAPFAASKHALLGLGLSLEQELRAQPIRITSFCPGPIAAGGQGDEIGDAVARALDPDVLADTIVHLAGLPPEVEIKQLVVEPVMP